MKYRDAFAAILVRKLVLSSLVSAFSISPGLIYYREIETVCCEYAKTARKSSFFIPLVND